MENLILGFGIIFTSLYFRRQFIAAGGPETLARKSISAMLVLFPIVAFLTYLIFTNESGPIDFFKSLVSEIFVLSTFMEAVAFMGDGLWWLLLIIVFVNLFFGFRYRTKKSIKILLELLLTKSLIAVFIFSIVIDLFRNFACSGGLFGCSFFIITIPIFMGVGALISLCISLLFSIIMVKIKTTP